MEGRSKVTALPSGRLTRLVEAEGPDVLAYFERRVRPVEDAADLFGEVLVVASRRASDLPSDDHEARLWLFGVARNILANHRRGAHRRLAATGRLRTEVIRVHRIAQAPSEADARVREAVSALPDDLGELVRLVHWDGFGIGEAGRLLGINPSTARGRYARARDLLTEQLSPTGRSRAVG